MTDHQALLMADKLFQKLTALAKRYRSTQDRPSGKQILDELLPLLNGPERAAVTAALAKAGSFHE